jgi:zinc transport system permease protein
VLAEPTFLDNWQFWLEAMVASVAAGFGLGGLGVWVALKRVVYVPLAVSQVAAVGVVLAFLIEEHLLGEGDGVLHSLCEPSLLSLVLAVASAFYFARPQAGGDRATGLAWVAGGAAVLLLGSLVRGDIHDVQGILFGNAVLVESTQMWATVVVLLVVAAVHGLWYRRFLYISFDPSSAGASGLSVYRHEVLLYATFALMISAATRVLGALPAFGLTLLPALAALTLQLGMRGSIALAASLGAGAAGVGYYLSFRFDLPTGATMVVVALGWILIAQGVAWLRGRVARATDA